MMRRVRVYRFITACLLLLYGIAIIESILLLHRGLALEFASELMLAGISVFFLLLLGGLAAGKERADEDELNQHFLALRRKAERGPRKYMGRLVWLVRQGSLYLFSLLFGIVSTLAGLFVYLVQSGKSAGFFAPFVAAMVGVAYAILSSLYIKIPLPSGYQVKGNNYPQIHAVLAKAARSLKIRKAPDVHLEFEPVCAVAALPRRLSGRRLYLFIGLHCLEVLGLEELRAVFTHELAHFYHKDTRLTAKIASSRERWLRISQQSDKKGFLSRMLIQRFSQYYCQTLELHYAALAKEKEYMADRVAAKHTSKEIMAAALAKLDALDLFMAHPDSELDFRDRPQPPNDYYSQLFARFYQSWGKNEVQWMNVELGRSSAPYDTHPSLKERLLNLGLRHLDPLTFAKAPEYGEEVARLTEVANREWQAAAREAWDEYCSDYRRSVEIIAQQSQSDAPGELEYGRALETVGRHEEALEFYTEYLSRRPDDALAMWRRGALMLRNDDPAGMDWVKRAMETDNQLIGHGLKLLLSYCMSQDKTEEWERLQRWAEAMAEVYHKIEAERNTLQVSDALVPAQLDISVYLAIKKVLKQNVPVLARAYLAQRELRLSKDKQIVVAVDWRYIFSSKKIEKALADIYQGLAELGIPFFLLDLRTHRPFLKLLKQVPGSRIY